MNVSAHNVPNKQLNQVLHNYQLFAMSALGGPAHWNSEMAKLAAGARFTESYKAALESIQAQGKDLTRALPFDFKLPQRLPVQPNPILMPADTSCEQGETSLEGESIACFEIGGEKRLCLPQLLKTVLARFSLDVINQACDDLYIYCSRCNPGQLEMFKRTGNLPASASTCGLITLTDAERLCTTLLHKSGDVQKRSECESPRRRLNESCVPVYHECFGEGRGFLRSDLYFYPDAKCIECADCGKLFSTKTFVSHSHHNQENRICHWGFDRERWSSYLMFDNECVIDEAESDRLENAFINIVNRFQVTSQDRKRKLSGTPEEHAETKQRRASDSQIPISMTLPTPWLSSPTLSFPPTSLWPATSINNFIREAAVLPLRPRLPTQMSCPPTLENPENVVTSSESSRYEKHFVPNIALQQSNGLDELEQDEDKSDGSVSPVASVKKERTSTSDYNGNENVDVCCSPKHESFPSPGFEKMECSTTAYMNIIDNLAKMEKQYLKVLQTSAMSDMEKDEFQQKYVACSDSIRQQLDISRSENKS